MLEDLRSYLRTIDHYKGGRYVYKSVRYLQPLMVRDEKYLAYVIKLLWIVSGRKEFNRILTIMRFMSRLHNKSVCRSINRIECDSWLNGLSLDIM